MRRSRLRQNSYWIILAAAVAATCFAGDRRRTQVADFYRGKTITISVGFSAGGGYDLHARTLARVLFGRHMPGNPTVVVKNVPGAGGLMLMNALSNTCRRTAPNSRPSTAAWRSSRCSTRTRRATIRASSTGSAAPTMTPAPALRGTPLR